MVVFPKQICKRFLPDTGESRSDITFFLKTNMELEVCTSLGSMFHRRGVLYMCVVLSLAAYAAHLFSHLRTHPLISVICTMCTLEALDILPLKTSLCSVTVSNLIFHNYTCLHGVSFLRYNMAQWTGSVPRARAPRTVADIVDVRNMAQWT